LCMLCSGRHNTCPRPVAQVETVLPAISRRSLGETIGRGETERAGGSDAWRKRAGVRLVLRYWASGRVLVRQIGGVLRNERTG